VKRAKLSEHAELARARENVRFATAREQGFPAHKIIREQVLTSWITKCRVRFATLREYAVIAKAQNYATFATEHAE